MHDPIAPLLDENGFLLLDGALATELEARGADLNDPLWSAKTLIEAPELIEAVHDAYFRAGADIATSASYQATFEGFEARGVDERAARELLRRSVFLAARARDRAGGGLVAASIGCYGAFLHDGSEYHGEYGLSRGELRDFHRNRVETLAAAGPDLLAFETIPSLIEAQAIVDLLAEHPVPAWISFSCRDERDVSRGEPFADCVAVAASSPSVVAVGLNCTPPRFVSSLLRSAAGATSKPLLAYPNSGDVWDAAAHRWIPARERISVADHAAEWHALGARIVGGCCRTSPETIRSMRAALG